MGESEAHRNKWALGLSLTLTIFIFIGFAYYKDFIGFGNNNYVAQKNLDTQSANVISTDLVPSPLQNSKETFGVAFEEIIKQYSLLKKSIAGVLVPFVTGIDVYERK